MFCSDVEAPAALSQSWTAVGTIWGVSKPGGQNIKKCLQLRNTHPLRSRFSGHSREADLVYTWGRPMTQGKKQVSAPCGTAGVGGLASREGFAEITSGRSHFAAGLETTCKDFSNEGRTRSREEGDGIGA
jgi:hypothetical protein